MKSKIIEDVQDIQNRVDTIGYKGSNEHDLELREQLAEYILSKVTEFKEKFFKAIDQEKADSCKAKESGGFRTGDYRIGLEKAKDLFENSL